MPNQKSRSLLLGRWALCLAVCATAVADDALPGGNDASSPAGVSVPDSPGAKELLDKARDKESQKQWKTAAEFYQEAMTKYPGRVVAISRDVDKGIFQYSGIAPIVQDRLAKWPADGLTIYRNLYGQTAADLLSSAGTTDCGALRNIFWNYFATDAGKTAGARLVDAYLESGDFQAAQWIGHRLLDLHPSLAGDRGMIIYRTALASRWAGHSDQAQALLDRLKQQDPNAVGSIGGKDVPLVESLTAVFAAPPLLPTTRPGDADTYPSYGGLGGRGDISPSSAKPGASLNSVQLTPPDFGGLAGNQKTALQQTDQLALANNLAMGIMPVVDGGSLFFQDGRSVYAVDADNGAPLPGWLGTYPGDRNGRYKINAFGRARSELLTVSVNPSCVLAILGQPDRGSMLNVNFAMQPPQNSTVKLVCLDRETGRELWSKTPAALPASAAALLTTEYSGTPLIIPASQAGHGVLSNSDNEDSVLVIARGSKQNQFDDCYVVCLSLKTGTYRWSTYIGSATRNVDMDGMISEDPSAMALANGRVFVMTNLGTVAALDPADGRMLWLNSYSRDASENFEALMMRGRRFGGGGQGPGGAGNSTGKVWAHNPVFVSDGNVFALPTDAHELFVYDAGSGQEQKRLRMTAWDNAGVLLGVRNGSVCLTSDKGVFVVDWKKYDDEDPKSSIRWSEPDITGVDKSEITGRGFLTSDSIFIPTRSRLVQKTWKSGKTVSNYPERGSFTGDQGPGNLLVTAHNIVVAGQTRVDVYTDLGLVKRKYEIAMAAAPNDPQPRVQYAEALFAGGQIKDALARVDEAIDRIGGINSMRSGRDRTMLFNAMLDFAHRADKNAENDKDDAKKREGIAQTNAFYDRAAAAADSPTDNATYRLERASFDHQQKDFAGEVRLCQEVLSQAAMRNASLADDTNAGAAAEAAIDQAINDDHSVYAPVEAQAASALADARHGDDPSQLLAVATVYPNSKAAIDARQDAVHRFEAANQPEKAIDVLRRIYTTTSDNSGKVQVLVSVANDFLATPDGLGPAIDRLCRAAKITSDPKLGQPLRFSDGTSLTDATYVSAIAKLRQMQADQDMAKLPDFHLAIPKPRLTNPFKREVVISGVAAVVHPLLDFDRPSQMLIRSASGLSVYAADATTPTYTIAQINEPPLGAAWVHDSLLVWTSSKLFQIDNQGKIAWIFSIAPLPSVAVNDGGDAVVDDGGESGADEVAGNVRLVRINGQLIQMPPGVVARGGRIVRFNNGLVGGGIAPVAVPVLARPAEEQIVAVQPAGPQANQVLVSTTSGRVLALGGRNGQVVWQTRMVDKPVDQVLANGHFTVIRTDDPSGSQVAVYETATGRLIGRRRFGPDNSPNQLVNVALSEEATLAMTLYGKVVVKDLYDPWKLAPRDMVAQANDAAPYVGLNQPDQLLVKAGRLVCLYDSGSYARGYDLSANTEPTLPLQTQASTTVVSLRMVGPRLYILTSNRMLQYNLADATDHFNTDPAIVRYVPTRTRAPLMLGKDYALVMYDPVDRGPAGSPLVAMVCTRLAFIKGTTRLRGDMDYCPEIQSVGLTDYLGTDGGFCYLTRDGNLHVLRGGRQ